MEKIIASIRTTNPALKVNLREDIVKEFKHSPRGLMMALDWLTDMNKALIEAQGNLSYPRQALEIGGVTLEGWDLDNAHNSVVTEGNGHWTDAKSRTQNAKEFLAYCKSKGQAA